MRRLSFLPIILIVTACAGEPELSCETVFPIEGVTSAPDMQVYADEIVDLASELNSDLSLDRSLAGFPGTITKRLAGTDAYTFSVELKQLERLVALQVAREQATRNDGLPLVNPKEPWACQMLAVSVASLDQGQSSDRLLRHIRRIEDYFGSEYPFREVSGDTQ